MKPSALLPARQLLSPALTGYLLADLLGMVLIAQGGSFLVSGSPLLLLGLPQNFLSAILFIVAGFVLLFWALARVLICVASHNTQQQTQTPC